MAWTTAKWLSFRQTLAFASVASNEVVIVGSTGTASNLPSYPVSYTQDGDTFNIGWSVGGGTDGVRNRTINVISSSDQRLDGIHANIGNSSGATLKIQAGTASGQYKIWLGIMDFGNTAPGTISFVLRDSNGTLLSKLGLTAFSNSGQIYDATGTLYSSGANWAAAVDGGGIAVTVTTSDTSNGNGGPFFYLDIGNGSTYTPLASMGIQYLGAVTPLYGTLGQFDPNMRIEGWF